MTPWVVSSHVRHDKGDNIGVEAVVAACTSGARAVDDHDGVASFLVELGHSPNNNDAMTMMAQAMLGEND